MIDVEVLLFLAVFFFGKMICAYDSFVWSKGDAQQSWRMSAKRSRDWGRSVSPTGALCRMPNSPGCVNFFYCLCWWFSRKDFLRVNKYLSCAVRKTFFCRSPFFSSIFFWCENKYLIKTFLFADLLLSFPSFFLLCCTIKKRFACKKLFFKLTKISQEFIFMCQRSNLYQDGVKN